MRKHFSICKNKDTDQLCCNHGADQRLCFCYIVQSFCFLNPKYAKISHLLWLYSPVRVRPGWKPPKTGSCDTALMELDVGVVLAGLHNKVYIIGRLC